MMLSTKLSRFVSLGLANPAILPARLSVQAACKEKYGWDDPVDKALVEQWNKAGNSCTSTVIHVSTLIKPKTSEVVEMTSFVTPAGIAIARAPISPSYIQTQVAQLTMSSRGDD